MLSMLHNEHLHTCITHHTPYKIDKHWYGYSRHPNKLHVRVLAGSKERVGR